MPSIFDKLKKRLSPDKEDAPDLSGDVIPVSVPGHLTEQPKELLTDYGAVAYGPGDLVEVTGNDAEELDKDTGESAGAHGAFAIATARHKPLPVGGKGSVLVPNGTRGRVRGAGEVTVMVDFPAPYGLLHMNKKDIFNVSGTGGRKRWGESTRVTTSAPRTAAHRFSGGTFSVYPSTDKSAQPAGVIMPERAAAIMGLRPIGQITVPSSAGTFATPLANLTGVRASVLDKANEASIREARASGVPLPPIKIEVTDSGYVRLVDGHHRLAVARAEGDSDIEVQWIFPAGKHVAMPMPRELPEGWKLDKQEYGSDLHYSVSTDRGEGAAQLQVVRMPKGRWVVIHSKATMPGGWGAFLYEQALQDASEAGATLESDSQVSGDAARVWDKYFRRDDVEREPRPEDDYPFAPIQESTSHHRRPEESLRYRYRLKKGVTIITAASDPKSQITELSETQIANAVTAYARFDLEKLGLAGSMSTDPDAERPVSLSMAVPPKQMVSEIKESADLFRKELLRIIDLADERQAGGTSQSLVDAFKEAAVQFYWTQLDPPSHSYIGPQSFGNSWAHVLGMSNARALASAGNNFVDSIGMAALDLTVKLYGIVGEDGQLYELSPSPTPEHIPEGIKYSVVEYNVEIGDLRNGGKSNYGPKEVFNTSIVKFDPDDDPALIDRLEQMPHEKLRTFDPAKTRIDVEDLGDEDGVESSRYHSEEQYHDPFEETRAPRVIGRHALSASSTRVALDIDPQPIGQIGDTIVEAVNGEVLRDTKDSEFTMGGNPSRYEYVPEGRIYLDRGMTPKDTAAIAIHEYDENEKMTDDGMPYERAHDHATELEHAFRTTVRSEDVDPSDPIASADDFLSKYTSNPANRPTSKEMGDSGHKNYASSASSASLTSRVHLDAGILHAPPRMFERGKALVEKAVLLFARDSAKDKILENKNYPIHFEDVNKELDRIEEEPPAKIQTLGPFDKSIHVWIPPARQGFEGDTLYIIKHSTRGYSILHSDTERPSTWLDADQTIEKVKSEIRSRRKVMKALLDHTQNETAQEDLQEQYQALEAQVKDTSDLHPSMRGERIDFYLPFDLRDWRYEAELPRAPQIEMIVSVVRESDREIGGDWSARAKHIRVLVGDRVPSDPQGLRAAVERAVSTFEHELTHAAQTLIQEGKGLDRPGGLPGVNYEYGRDPYAWDYAHPKRPIEFYPNLVTELNQFKTHFPVDDSQWFTDPIEQARSWVVNRPRFQQLREYDEKLWQKAVTEFMREVQKFVKETNQTRRERDETQSADDATGQDAMDVAASKTIVRIARDLPPELTLDWHGLKIYIEAKGGTVRLPDDQFPQYIPADWVGMGYFVGLEEPDDGDSLDVIVGHKDIDDNPVFLVVQTDGDEEHPHFRQWKVFIGFETEMEVEGAFRIVWRREMFGGVFELSQKKFRKFVLPRIVSKDDAKKVATRAEEGVTIVASTNSRRRVTAARHVMVDPNRIEPPHVVKNLGKYDRLTQSMIEEGWNGRPILAYWSNGSIQALTGSHRIAAARAANILSIPVWLLEDVERMPRTLPFNAPARNPDTDAPRSEESLKHRYRFKQSAKDDVLVWHDLRIVLEAEGGHRRPSGDRQQLPDEWRGLGYFEDLHDKNDPDEQELDVVVGPGDLDELVHLGIQLDDESRFRQFKCFLGFLDEAQAEAAFKLLWQADTFGGMWTVPAKRFRKLVLPRLTKEAGLFEAPPAMVDVVARQIADILVGWSKGFYRDPDVRDRLEARFPGVPAIPGKRPKRFTVPIDLTGWKYADALTRPIPWKKITVVVQKDVMTRNEGVWNDLTRTLTINVPFIGSDRTIGHDLERIPALVEHELQHFGQFLLGYGTGQQPGAAGLPVPGREYNPVLEAGEQYESHLREFYPLLRDEIAAFHESGLGDARLFAEHSPFFQQLKARDEALWRKAVSLFVQNTQRAKGASLPRLNKAAVLSLEVDPARITPPHGVKNVAKKDRLVESMRENGWDGRPLLVYRSGGGYQAITGSHRLSAAREAELARVPVLLIEDKDFSDATYTALDEADDNYDRLRALEDLLGENPLTQEAYELMMQELAEKNRVRRFTRSSRRSTQTKVTLDALDS